MRFGERIRPGSPQGLLQRLRKSSSRGGTSLWCVRDDKGSQKKSLGVKKTWAVRGYCWIFLVFAPKPSSQNRLCAVPFVPQDTRDFPATATPAPPDDMLLRGPGRRANVPLCARARRQMPRMTQRDDEPRPGTSKESQSTSTTSMHLLTVKETANQR